MKRIRMLLAAFTALFLLMSALPAQAGSPEISDLLTEYYKEWQELPFGLTEDELTCVDGVCMGGTFCCCIQRRAPMPAS